jgi:hypothetical protein
MVLTLSQTYAGTFLKLKTRLKNPNHDSQNGYRHGILTTASYHGLLITRDPCYHRSLGPRIHFAIFSFA